MLPDRYDPFEWSLLRPLLAAALTDDEKERLREQPGLAVKPLGAGWIEVYSVNADPPVHLGRFHLGALAQHPASLS